MKLVSCERKLTGYLLNFHSKLERNPHISRIYHPVGTEKAVGEAIRESGIPREEIFVTTKLP